MLAALTVRLFTSTATTNVNFNSNFNWRSCSTYGFFQLHTEQLTNGQLNVTLGLNQTPSALPLRVELRF